MDDLIYSLYRIAGSMRTISETIKENIMPEKRQIEKGERVMGEMDYENVSKNDIVSKLVYDFADCLNSIDTSKKELDEEIVWKLVQNVYMLRILLKETLYERTDLNYWAFKKCHGGKGWHYFHDRYLAYLNMIIKCGLYKDYVENHRGEPYAGKETN